MKIREKMNIPGKIDLSSVSSSRLNESFVMRAKGDWMAEGLIETITNKVLKRLKQTE